MTNQLPVSQNPLYSREERHIADVMQLSLREFNSDYDPTITESSEQA